MLISFFAFPWGGEAYVQNDARPTKKARVAGGNHVCLLTN
jgi:hypothetical protein